jgi:outer membrane receptor protein involved in Fe transport
VRRNRDLPLVGPTLDKPGEVPRPWPVQDTDRLDLSVSRSQRSGSVEWTAELTYTDQDRHYDSRRGGAQSFIGYGGVTESEYNASKIGVSLSANMPIGERHLLEFLGEYTDEGLKVDDEIAEELGGISDYKETGWDLNLQDTIALDKAGTFLATPSIRWHKIGEEDHLTWQMSLTKEFPRGLMLKSAYGTYARAPNLYENYGDGAFIIRPKGGAGKLRWETGSQFDLGILWNGEVRRLGGARAGASLSAFWRDTDDLIELYMDGPRFARYANIAESNVKGVEFETALDWEKWGFSLSATWMDGKNKSPAEGTARYYGKALPNRPEWSWIARLTRKFGRGSIFAEYQYVGENYVDTLETVMFSERNVFNMGVKYDLSPTTRLTLGVDDVFDDAEGWRMKPAAGFAGATRVLWYPIEGRTYYMTLDMRF